MGAKTSLITPDMEYICPKCPLTPIISICLNSEGNLACEYRCPFMHFGQIPFEQIFTDKEGKHGKYCDRCVKTKGKSEETNIVKEELLYCGTCKEFICTECRPKHDEAKESHKTLVPKSKIRYTCLEHGKNFIGFCFTCLISICKDCKRHEKHCKKPFEDFYPDNDFLENYKYYTGDFSNYISSFKRSHGMNKDQFGKFKQRCQLLLDLAEYLKKNFEQKMQKNKLNGETLINYLNVVNFNFKAEKYDKVEEFVKYCKTHLILSNKPISDICTFSKTKSDYNISKLEMEEFSKLPHIEKDNPPEIFKYSPIGQHIVYSIGSSIHFLSTQKEGNENKGFKIRLDNEVSSFNIINQNILCVCCNKLYFYQLSKNGPYYSEYSALPVLDIFDTPVLEIIGDLEKDLVVRTKKHLLVVNDKKKKGNYEIVAKIDLEDINKIITEKKQVPDENANHNYYYYGYGNHNRTKTIEIHSRVRTSIKGIWEGFVVTIENGFIITRNLKDLSLVAKFNKYKNTDCLVFNGNVLTFNSKQILFYTIPSLTYASTINVNDDVLSLNVVNKKTFIVVEKKYFEQFEVNTWKRLWRQLSFGENLNKMEKILVIGAGKDLFLFQKEIYIIYKAILRVEGDKKKSKKK